MMNGKLEIDLLYTQGCPSWKIACDFLKAALAAEAISASIRLVPVESQTQAGVHKFLGSPSIQINGQDLWPEQRSEYALTHRIYLTARGARGWPSVDMLRQKLRELQPQI